MSRSTERWVLLAGGALLSWMFVSQAWMVDDAYITLRTVDNFVNGLGLTWNPEERVQVFTHPLWMFLLSVFYFFTRETFVTTLLLSFALLVALLVLAERRFRGDERWRLYFFGLVLIASKAFFDYTSSGLENPLSHLLAAAFVFRFLWEEEGDAEARLKRFGTLLLIAALSFVNRIDTLLLFLPVLVWEMVALLRQVGVAKTARALGLFTLPATGWVVFATFYFGAPMPNTAYAKALSNGIGMRDSVGAGLAYFLNSLEWDPVTLVLIASSIVAALWARRERPIVLGVGILAYLLYILMLGATGTHMSGRFFSTPFVVAALLLLYLIPTWRAAVPVAGLTAFFILVNPGSPIRSPGSGPGMGNGGAGRSGYIDTRYYVHREGAAFLSWERGRRWPNHRWYAEGRKFAASDEKVSVGGSPNSTGLAIGYYGFGAGPDKFIIDVLGLSDPLLARLPMDEKWRWYPGHFKRVVPEGYAESIRTGENRIRDPDLHRFYEKIRLITRGDLFSLERLGAIFELQTGALKPLVQAYASRLGEPRPTKRPQLAPVKMAN